MKRFFFGGGKSKIFSAAGIISVGLGFFNVIFFHFSPEGVVADAEKFGGLGLVPISAFEDA